MQYIYFIFHAPALLAVRKCDWYLPTYAKACLVSQLDERREIHLINWIFIVIKKEAKLRLYINTDNYTLKLDGCGCVFVSAVSSATGVELFVTAIKQGLSLFRVAISHPSIAHASSSINCKNQLSISTSLSVYLRFQYFY